MRIFLAFLAFLAVAGVASPLAVANDSNDIVGYRYGCVDYVATGAWDTLTSASLENMGGSSALPASHYWTELFIKSPSATIYVCTTTGASCGANTTNKLAVAANATITLSIRGLTTKSVALQATAATTAQACGMFRVTP